MYHGPYPTNSKSGASSAAVSSPTTTASSISTPVASLAGTTSVASQQTVGSSQVGK
jgi:hypothetical protein